MLLQVMESERQNLVVVMAGYSEPMEEFFQANPGMGSRVAHHIAFPDYDVDELMQIAELMVDRQGYELSDDAGEALREYIERRLERPRFAHGRSIRNADRARADAPGHPAVRLGRKAHAGTTSSRSSPTTSRRARCSATPDEAECLDR